MFDKIINFFTLSNKAYDVLKFVTICVLPELATLYAALSVIWGFPYGDEITGTFAAIIACCGGILGISTVNYKKKHTED